MNNDQAIIEALDARVKRREERRAFFQASAAFAGVSLLAACSDSNNNPPPIGGTPSPSPSPSPSPTPSPTPGAIGDPEILNFALNLEYLEAQFYSFAAFGEGLPPSLLGGQGTQGAVTGGRRVNFTDNVVRLYAREIAMDERAHVQFLRQALGSAAVAQPAINISGDANGAFTAAARAAGVVGASGTFDPYASDENFLLGAYIFEDVGVTAYKGASPLITNKTFLEAAAGILAAEAYHAALIRTVLYGKGVQMPALRENSEKISDARDSLDGPSDLDQGVQKRGDASNIVPADMNAIAFSRTPGQVLNIVYLTRMMAQQGGFFPNGVNGAIRASAANG
jgi:hypothetical protein